MSRRTREAECREACLRVQELFEQQKYAKESRAPWGKDIIAAETAMTASSVMLAGIRGALLSAGISLSVHMFRKLMSYQPESDERDVELAMRLDQIRACAREDFDAALRSTAGTRILLTRESEEVIRIDFRG